MNSIGIYNKNIIENLLSIIISHKPAELKEPPLQFKLKFTGIHSKNAG